MVCIINKDNMGDGMDSICSWIRDKKQYIDDLLEQYETVDAKRTGSVYCSTSRGRAYYVRKIHSHGRDKKLYLGKADSDNVIAEKNAQMDSKLHAVLDKDKKIIEECLSRYMPFDISSIEGMTSPCLHVVKNDFVIDKRMEKLFAWANEPYERNGVPFADKVILTKDGTRARSKDECLLYDLFYDANVPNRYDCILDFEDPWDPGNTIRKAPDFVVPTLSGKLILVEHAGLIMNRNYASDLMEKIQIYLYNGYVLGDNFFISSGDRFGGVNERALERLVDEIKDRILYW